MLSSITELEVLETKQFYETIGTWSMHSVELSTGVQVYLQMERMLYSLNEDYNREIFYRDNTYLYSTCKFTA